MPGQAPENKLEEARRWREFERQLRGAGWSRREACAEVAREKARERREPPEKLS